MLEKIAIFFIFLGPLVFFHELGHFLFARLAGVRVETFSIGFGPKLFSFKKGDTVYAFSLIPLGGYVKMFGDDPLSDEELTDEEKKVAYTHKSKMSRFWIVFGGPLANFILAFFIYFSLVTVGEKVPETNFGLLTKENIFFKNKVKTGDTLVKVNDQEISSFDDLNMIDSTVSSITVERDTTLIEMPLQLSNMEFLKEFSSVSTPLRAPVVVKPDGSKYALIYKDDLVSYEQLTNVRASDLKIVEIKKEIPVEFSRNFVTSLSSEKKIKDDISLNKYLEDNNLYTIDLMIKNISMDSPASRANLKKGDIITHVNNSKITSFTDLKKEVKSTKEGETVIIKYLNKSGENQVSILPIVRDINGEKVKSIGIESHISFLSIMKDVKATGFLSGIKKALHRTYDGTLNVLAGFKKLITGEVSLKHVGGPLAIGKVASDSFDISLSMFFRLMALISINLGVINLFPIPVLDGGHIVFLGLEFLNGGPLSRKKMQYAQQVGMSLLFLLIFVALFNDITRFF